MALIYRGEYLFFQSSFLSPYVLIVIANGLGMMNRLNWISESRNHITELLNLCNSISLTIPVQIA